MGCVESAQDRARRTEAKRAYHYDLFQNVASVKTRFLVGGARLGSEPYTTVDVVYIHDMDHPFVVSCTVHLNTEMGEIKHAMDHVLDWIRVHLDTTIRNTRFAYLPDAMLAVDEHGRTLPIHTPVADLPSTSGTRLLRLHGIE